MVLIVLANSGQVGDDVDTMLAMLVDLIEGRQPKSPEVRLPAKIVMRESTRAR